MSWQKGEDEWEELVFEDDRKGFLVVIDKALKVYWETTHEFDGAGHANEQEHNRVLSEATAIEVMPHDFLSRENTINFKRLIGEAITRSLQGDYSNAKAMLAQASLFLCKRQSEASKKWYVLSSLAVTVLVLVATLFINNHSQVFEGLQGKKFVEYVYWISAGALGAFFSVGTRVGALHFDYGAEKFLYYLEGSLRIAIGCISAVFIASALQSGLIFSAAVKGGCSTEALFVFSFAAGLSERLIPSIVSTLTKPTTVAEKN